MFAKPPSSIPQPACPDLEQGRLSPLDATRTSGHFLRRIAICIATLLLACYTGHGEVRPPDSGKADASLTLRVYDFAGLDSGALQLASEEAKRIFQHVGIETAWVRCRTNFDAPDAPSCPPTRDPTVLAMRILAVPLPMVGLDSHFIFGFAFPPGPNGFANTASLFWSRIEELSGQQNLNPGRLLAAILVHEAGHLLLGKGSHYPVGVMKAVWTEAEMQLISRSSLAFWPKQEAKLHDAVEQRMIAAGPRRPGVEVAWVYPSF